MVVQRPNFFVIGAPRSGTTSLYEYLHAHPDVFMSTVKEPDFFARPQLDTVHPLDGPLEADLDRDCEPDPDLQRELPVYLALFEGASGQPRVGEASAVYLGHPTATWHLRGYVPDAKLLVVLRDPADRAYSHYLHARRIYAEHGQLEAVGSGGRSIDDEFARAVEVASREGMPDPAVSDPEVWVRAGFYYQHLTRTMKLFPPEQLKIFMFEELSSDPAGVMRQIYGFLDLDDSFELPTTEAFNATVVPRNQKLFALFTTKNSVMRYARSIAPPQVRGIAMRTRNRLLGQAKPPIDVELRRTLTEIYRDDVLALQDLLGRDLSAWLAEPAAGQTG